VEEADRLNSVVTEFLEYARPADRAPLRISLREPVERALARIRRERSKKMDRIRTGLHVAETVPKVNADPSEIERVVFNLLTNAVEAMPEGGDLTVRVHSAGGEGRISVEDTGTGVSDEDRPQLFRRSSPPMSAAWHGAGDLPQDRGGERGSMRRELEGEPFTIKLPGG
jgi:signal transduction histidine kinase